MREMRKWQFLSLSSYAAKKRSSFTALCRRGLGSRNEGLWEMNNVQSGFSDFWYAVVIRILVVMFSYTVWESNGVSTSTQNANSQSKKFELIQKFDLKSAN